MRKRNICTEVWKSNAHFFNQWKFSCSKILQLEAIWWFEELKQSVHFQSEISLIFWKNYRQTRAKSSNKQSKQNAQKNNKVYDYAYKMRNLPSAHKAWLLRTRNAGGVCSSVLMWCLGAPSILKCLLLYVQKMFIHEYKKEIIFNFISKKWIICLLL